ncbi:helix-turn-helix transcriptional regulator [Halorientalis marina]|uniref:helix-turn-helix transcriptional regulator n=1 Tax=Halorientalis marina TaxID=2931976 RepID=UPI001FF4B3C3|nr:helix-turn-helix transcriptional regulator [Halorientalis marina]
MSTSPLVNTLIQELSAGDELGAASPDAPSTEQETDPEQVLSSVMERLAVEESFAFDDEIVKQNLDEILIALISLRDGTHGKALIDDLSRLFDAELSPGTVYPRLHDIENDGTLAMHELVRTKEYSVDDDDDAKSRIERAMYHHLALGLFLHDSLDEL